MAGRRTDTRERIQRVAMELFAERGYDKTTLQEVAERLEITRPALYYHFRTKEEILSSIADGFIASLDELAEWARAQPDTFEARREILRRISELLEDKWRPLMRFAQMNQGAFAQSSVGDRMQDRIVTLVSVLSRPGADAIMQFEARLAVFALILGGVPEVFGMDLPPSELASTAMTVAVRLVSDHEPSGQ
ncbi:TetR/AcrR family transcriptional regulator [Nonomuraea aurantiaca]|jgi:AcrR family transcriptional regulator|uniref:TetR/AcrR family transcriptional regulator n=1 Tax=Nonomuraea aurantiaca TaxID=2878562 RepID=UPI001CD96EFA|nr:TetR/AcrR family transcriptional regulator [Nonomuraea aurantiaca]MCA2220552.1 TetR/AcrR family transcriptional regulator [Nonomuraea aurantiaca]